jgi:hypothetical protein
VPHDFQPATAPQPAQDRDFEGEEFAQAQSYRLDRLRLAAREEQIAADLDLTDDLHPGLSAHSCRSSSGSCGRIHSESGSAAC